MVHSLITNIGWGNAFKKDYSMEWRTRQLLLVQFKLSGKLKAVWFFILYCCLIWGDSHRWSINGININSNPCGTQTSRGIPRHTAHSTKIDQNITSGILWDSNLEHYYLSKIVSCPWNATEIAHVDFKGEMYCLLCYQSVSDPV